MSLLTLFRVLVGWGVARPLAGDSTSTTLTDGTLYVRQGLVGDSSSVTTADGTLLEAEALAGDSLTTSLSDGTLNVLQSVVGDSLSISTASGTLSHPLALSGDSLSTTSALGMLFEQLFAPAPVEPLSTGGGGFGRLPKSWTRPKPKYVPPKHQPPGVTSSPMPSKEERVLVSVMGLTTKEVEEIVYDHNMRARVDHILGKR